MRGVAGIYAYHYAANPVEPGLLGEDNTWCSADRKIALRSGAPLALAGDAVLASEGRESPAILPLYRQASLAALGSLENSATMALWDVSRQRFVIARGREGPPLYYADDGWVLNFASSEDDLRRLAPHAFVEELPAGHFVMTDRVGAGPALALGASVAGSAPARLRVLALVTDAYGGYGGIARYNRDFLDALAADDRVAAIEVLPRLPEVTQERPPHKVTQRGPVMGRLAYTLNALRIAIFNGPFDVVFCGHVFMAPVAALVARILGARLWATVHGYEVWDRPSAPVRWGMAAAGLIMAVSRHTRHQLSRWLSGPRERVRVLPNTVRPEFRPGPVPEAFARRFRKPGGQVLLSVSRLARADRYKGITRVMDVLPRLVEEFPALAWVVAGDGDDRDALGRMCAERGLAGHVHFVGRVPDAELGDYYRLADVFVLPSFKEGFGIVFVEAAISGAAVIGGNADGSVDALADGAIGAPVDPADGEALYLAIRQALSSPRPDAARAERFCQSNFQAHVAALLSGPAFA